MEAKKIYILFFFFGIVIIPFTVFGNTREYCEEQLKLADIERQNENYVKSIDYLIESYNLGY